MVETLKRIKHSLKNSSLYVKSLYTTDVQKLYDDYKRIDEKYKALNNTHNTYIRDNKVEELISSNISKDIKIESLKSEIEQLKGNNDLTLGFRENHMPHPCKNILELFYA